MKQVISAVNTSKNAVAMVFKWTATAIFGTQCVVMLLQIFMRRIVNRPFVWAEDLVVLLFVWVTYLGAAVLYSNGKLITVDLFVMTLPNRAKAAASAAVDILIAVVSIYILIVSSQFLDKQIMLGHKLGGALGLPSWTMTLALVASISSMVLSSFAKILNRLSKL